MPELENVEQPKTAGFMTRGKSKNAQRIEAEEKEIEELEKQLRGETEETSEGNDEEKAEAKGEAEAEDKEELKGEEKTYKKRYGDLRRHQQKVEQELKAQIDELKTQLQGKKDGIALPKSDEDITAWMKKYPDVAGIVKALVAKETDQRLQSAKLDLDEIRKSQEEGKLQKARASIIKAHPDFEELEESDEFHDWVDEQPKWIADALFENPDQPDAVIRVLDLYKSDTSGLTPSKKAEKEAAKSVTAKGRTAVDATEEKGTFKESQVAKMSDKEYEANEEAILEAMRKGKFIYDLSGGAR